MFVNTKFRLKVEYLMFISLLSEYLILIGESHNSADKCFRVGLMTSVNFVDK